MEIQYRCGALKDRVAMELQEALDTHERGEVLIAALYELSRSVRPLLGRPGKSQEYQEMQGAVLELISFIAIPLIRNCTQVSRGVAVLTEIAEGCLDPLLKRKLCVYAQELLAKSRTGALHKTQLGRRWIPWLIVSGAAVALGLYLSFPGQLAPRKDEAPDSKEAFSAISAPAAYQAAVPQPATEPAAGPGVGFGLSPAAGAGRERIESAAENPAQPEPEVKAGATLPAEQATRVKIANNQVLVPVTLKNGGETVRVEPVRRGPRFTRDLPAGSTSICARRRLSSRKSPTAD